MCRLPRADCPRRVALLASALQRNVADRAHSCTQQSRRTRPACRTKRVFFTIDMSFNPVRGVSCLPGGRPGGCASLREGSCSSRDTSREPLWRGSSASAPAAVRHPSSKMRHSGLFSDPEKDMVRVCRDAWGTSGRGYRLEARLSSLQNSYLSRYCSESSQSEPFLVPCCWGIMRRIVPIKSSEHVV
jgi:hypothetical protein